MIARRLRALANEAVAALGLSDASGWAMLQIHRSGPEASQAKLAAALQISGPSLVRLLDRLEQQRYLRRIVSTDRRLNRIELTVAGKAMAERIEAILVPMRTDLFDGVPDADLETVLAVLDAIEARSTARDDDR